ncbi:MAG: hypothetical protein JW787_06475 [Sedimentisphaerales bacterium]|nr:hypothetical protein [Sedimentisphaerales bacterium]
MKKEYKELYEDLRDEIAAIDETIERLQEIKNRFEPGVKDICIEPAMGTYLMNFYNGIENILKRVCKEYYKAMPRGESWHKELLILSANPPEGKTAIFDRSLVEKLHPFRSFRHRFVSGYGFQLKGVKMLDLIDIVEPLWNEIKSDITIFWNKLYEAK